MKIFYLTLAILLLFCLAPMPYGFYQLVRFIAMILFMVFAYDYWNKGLKSLAATFGALSLLFQPFLKISLGRTIWNIVDIVAAIGLILIFFQRKNNI